jgi:hypothetical protein
MTLTMVHVLAVGALTAIWRIYYNFLYSAQKSYDEKSADLARKTVVRYVSMTHASLSSIGIIAMCVAECIFIFT